MVLEGVLRFARKLHQSHNGAYRNWVEVLEGTTASLEHAANQKDGSETRKQALLSFACAQASKLQTFPQRPACLSHRQLHSNRGPGMAGLSPDRFSGIARIGSLLGTNLNLSTRSNQWCRGRFKIA